MRAQGMSIKSNDGMALSVRQNKEESANRFFSTAGTIAPARGSSALCGEPAHRYLEKEFTPDKKRPRVVKKKSIANLSARQPP